MTVLECWCSLLSTISRSISLFLFKLKNNCACAKYFAPKYQSKFLVAIVETCMAINPIKITLLVAMDEKLVTTVIRVHCVETKISLQSLQYLLRYLSPDQSGGATDRQQANTSVPRAEFFMFSERESHPCQPVRIKHCYIMFPSTSLPAAPHSKVRLNNMHFNALQKTHRGCFLLPLFCL